MKQKPLANPTSFWNSLAMPALFIIAGTVALNLFITAGIIGASEIITFILGNLLLFTGIVWAFIIIGKSVRGKWKDDKIVNRTKVDMRNPRLRRYYWVYAIACVLALAAAIIFNDINFMTSALLIIALGYSFLEYVKRRDIRLG